MTKTKVKFFSVLFCALILQGCASLPSTEVMKAETVNFQLPKQPAPGKSIVYVVRPSGVGTLIRFNIHVDSKDDSAEVGYTRGGQYIYFALTAGAHKIYSNAENWAEMSLTTKPGEVVYLQQEPAFGIIMARNNIFRIEETQGKYYVKTLSLGELIKPDGIPGASSSIAVQPMSEPPQPSPTQSAVNKLSQLDALKKKGLITQQDYDAKKAEILRGM